MTELAKMPLEHDMTWSDWRDQRGELFQAVKMEKKHDGIDARVNRRYRGL